VLAPGGHLMLAVFGSGGEPMPTFDHKVAPAFRWPVGDLAALAGTAGFAEVGPDAPQARRAGAVLPRASAAAQAVGGSGRRERDALDGAESAGGQVPGEVRGLRGEVAHEGVQP
jgi:hypothetical protein